MVAYAGYHTGPFDWKEVLYALSLPVVLMILLKVAPRLVLWPLYWIVVWPIISFFSLFPSRRYDNAIKCPGCGYDLRGTPDVCPECGRKVDALDSVIIKYQMKLDGWKSK